jgi:hypothetical protein
MVKKSLGTPPSEKDTRQTTAYPELTLDRRHLRKAGRNEQLNIPVSQEFKAEFRKLAIDNRLTAWQLLASSIRAFNQLPTNEKNGIIEDVVKADPAAHYKTR